MKRFAKPANQAARAVQRVSARGQSRHNARDDGLIHGNGTARNYEQALKLAAEWDRANGGLGLLEFNNERALEYLEERAEYVTQKTLDLDRQALQMLPGVDQLERVRSEVQKRGLADQGRAYTPQQVAAITAAQRPHNALATEIAQAAGLRAHELLTLRPASERPASTHRNWSADRFSGRNGIRYTVAGKGGLVREVLIPHHLADRLEAQRLEAPRSVQDRGITYEQHYRIGGGNAWSNSFGQASRRELGYSTGAHGLRHGYAQQRLEELQQAGRSYEQALGIISQEMGHFRADITEVYLR